MSITGRVGYVVKSPPRSGTSLASELLELESRGFPLHVFALGAGHAEPEGVSALRAPVTVLPQRLWREVLRIAAGHVAVWRRFPATYREALVRCLRRRPVSSLLAALRQLSQACCLLREGGALGHLHVHGATGPGRVAELVEEIAAIPYSIATRPADLYREGRLESPKVRQRLARARFVITDSRSSAERLRAATNGSAPARMEWIYRGIDLKGRGMRAGEPDEPLILAVGALVEKNGFADLIQACRLVRNRGERFRCEIIGAGPLWKTLAQLVRRLQLASTVRLCGPMPRSEIRAAFGRATVFVHPGRIARDGNRDVFPDGLKDAMALGVPAVASSLPGIAELATHGNEALLHPPGDVERLADALGLVLHDRGLRAALAAAGRSLVEERLDRRTSYEKLAVLLGRPDADPSRCAHPGPPASVAARRASV